MISKTICLFAFFFITTIVSFSQVQKPAYPVDTSYTIEGQYQKYVKDYPYLIPVKDECLEGVVAHRNEVYATLEKTKYGKRELHLDLFTPEKKGTYPALILVHGGAWQAGNKSLLVPLAQLIAKQGFVTVAVEYQLGLEAPYPAAVHNIKAAIRWMRANASEYQIDPDKIVIAGSSAGGHLASLVGLTNGMEHFEGEMGVTSQSSSVQAIIDIDGLVNFLSPIILNAKRKLNSADINWIGGSFTEAPELWKEVSPAYWANENSVPILFLNSGHPRFHGGQDELVGRLKEWGIYYEVHKFEVEMHTFWLFHPYVDMTAGYMVGFMNKVFR